MRLTSLAVRPAAVAAALGAASAAAGPTATASKACGVGDERSYGTTYVTAISVSNTSCRARQAAGARLPRLPPGKSGKCPSVKGYSCSEKRYNKSRDALRLERDLPQGQQDGQAHLHAFT